MDTDDTAHTPGSDNQPMAKTHDVPQAVSTKATIIGLYGVPGSGKSHLKRQLEEKLDKTKFLCFEGSEELRDVLANVGLDIKNIGKLKPEERTAYREAAIKSICAKCDAEKKVGIVTGHFIFWNEEIYTHILYLKTDPKTIVEQVAHDATKQGVGRKRPKYYEETVRVWQNTEKKELRLLCNDYGILFSNIEPNSVDYIVRLLQDFALHNENHNTRLAETKLDKVVADVQTARTFLVLDADKTLSASDASEFYWFGNAALRRVRSQDACDQENVGVVVLTCGMRRVWEKVLSNLNLSKITVMGGTRLSDDYVMTPELKDSKVDIAMLKAADEAYLVVTEGSVSKETHEQLQHAIQNEGLRLRQITHLQDTTSSLSTDMVPLAELDGGFVTRLKQHRALLKVFHATNKPASRLLAASTRNVNIYGVRLQKAHKQAGWYLANEYVTAILGLEPYDMQSVQGETIQGQRLANEKRTIIVPMMRGGEPMAFGVMKAFPEAMFHHVKDTEVQLQPKHLENMDTLILVDWVINTGKGIVEFVRHIRELSKQIRIVVVAGVVQDQAVGQNGEGGTLREELAGLGEVFLVALRISENKFKGVGATDTGHRLFNSTHFD
ncbi:hypothetical protein Q7P37_001637 [Cladosporium fusiforme]